MCDNNSNSNSNSNSNNNTLNYLKEELTELYIILLNFRTRIRRETKNNISNPELFMIHFTDQTYIDWIFALINRKRLSL